MLCECTGSKGRGSQWRSEGKVLLQISQSGRPKSASFNDLKKALYSATKAGYQAMSSLNIKTSKYSTF